MRSCADMLEKTMAAIHAGLAARDVGVAAHVQVVCLRLAGAMQTVFQLLRLIQDCNNPRNLQVASQLAAAIEHLWECLSSEQQVCKCCG